MKATFENTVDILVKAYFNDTLEHSNCFACAVGNIVAHNNGYEYIDCNRVFSQGKMKRFKAIPSWYNSINRTSMNETDTQIGSTGYSLDQIISIERAFEQGWKTRYDHSNEEHDKDGYHGLMAVVDVLAEIHNIDLTVREEAKLLFVKA